MEFKDIIAKRRSVRRFDGRRVPGEVVGRLLDAVFTAPSSRNSRSTRLLVVSNSEAVARMADMRDYGSAFLKNAPLAVVVMGDRTASDLWRENCAIAATVLQLACVDEGLASCWVHVDGRPQRRSEPDGAQAEEFLREFLPVPADCGVLCVVAVGYSDFTPAPLPAHDDSASVVWVE